MDAFTPTHRRRRGGITFISIGFPISQWPVSIEPFRQHALVIFPVRAVFSTKMMLNCNGVCDQEAQDSNLFILQRVRRQGWIRVGRIDINPYKSGEISYLETMRYAPQRFRIQLDPYSRHRSPKIFTAFIVSVIRGALCKTRLGRWNCGRCARWRTCFGTLISNQPGRC